MLLIKNAQTRACVFVCVFNILEETYWGTEREMHALHVRLCCSTHDSQRIACAPVRRNKSFHAITTYRGHEGGSQIREFLQRPTVPITPSTLRLQADKADNLDATSENRPNSDLSVYTSLKGSFHSTQTMA